MVETAIIGLAATRAPWSLALRAYLRDHTHGLSVTVVMDRPHLAQVVGQLDVLIVDDVMRLFAPTDVALAEASGVAVLGVHDDTNGLGEAHLLSLGVDKVLPAGMPPGEMVAQFEELRSRRPRRGRLPGAGTAWPVPGGDRPAATRTARVTVATKVSGGAGLSELVAAGAQHLSGRGPTLLIELDELAPVLVSRLSRSPDTGLPWSLARAAMARDVLPEGLSGPRGDGTAPVGRFDVMCAGLGPALDLSAVHFSKLMEQVVPCYTHVVVETAFLGLAGDRDRGGASRTALGLADRVIVVAAADPEGAARLVEWRAAAWASSLAAPVWAVFGRCGNDRYERAHLTALVEDGTGTFPFAGIAFFPEDPIVRRARWNGELVWKGPWLKAVKGLVDEVAAS